MYPLRLFAGALTRGYCWRQAVEDATRSWLSRHYPGIFEDILFGNHYGVEGKTRCGQAAACVPCQRRLTPGLPPQEQA